MAAQSAQPQTSREEKIGYHKGCLNTLIAERNELVRLVQITETLMQAHLKELESMGIKVSPSEETLKKK